MKCQKNANDNDVYMFILMMLVCFELLLENNKKMFPMIETLLIKQEVVGSILQFYPLISPILYTL